MTTPISLLLWLGFIWGSGYSIARYAMTHGVTPLGYAFWQSIGPALFLLLFITTKKQRLPCSLTHIRYYFLMGCLGIFIPNTNMYFTAAHLPAGILAVIVNTVPIIAYPIALLLKEEFFSFMRFMGVIVGVTGILLLTIPHAHLSVHANELPWALLALLSPFCFALCAILGNKFRPADVNSVNLSCGMLCISTLLLIPLVFGTHQFYSLNPPHNTAQLVVVLEIILSSIGYILFFELLKKAGPIYYSLTGTVVALTGLFWGYLLFGERLSFYSALSVLFILIAITLLTLKPRDLQKT